MITELRLKDFGPFADATLRLGALTVLVGRNNSGKTTLLRALSTLRDATVPGSRAKVRARIGGSGSWTLQAAVGEGSVRLTGPGRDYLADAEIDVGGVRYDKDSGERLKALGYFGPYTGIFAALWGREPGTPEQRPLTEVRDALAGIRAVRLNPAAGREPSLTGMSWTDWLDGGAAAGLPSALVSLVAEDPAAGAAIVQQFTDVFPEFRSYSTPLSGEAGHKTHHDLVFFTRGGAQLLADEVSDGVILHLLLLALVHGPTPPSMLLLEDLEAGVHPARLKLVCEVLRDWANRTGRQVVVTTHMPYLLDAIEPSEAWFCRRGTEGLATVGCFADLPDLDEELRVRSLGELWSSLGEEQLFELTHGVR